jgi:hypothetical protein
MAGDDLALIVIDGFGGRGLGDREYLGASILEAIRSKAIQIGQVLPPKPTPWQGKHRIMSCEWWAMSNARNTGLCYVPDGYDFVAFCDDRCHLGPEWLAQVRRADAERACVVAGGYEKHQDGHVTPDGRLAQSPSGRENCGGGWLFGCTLCLPLEWTLRVNGFEEGCDGLSFEDVIFGMNLERAGYQISYRPKMFVSQERSVAHANTFKRTDKGKSPNDKSHAALARFRKRARTEFTPDLRELRNRILSGERDPFPMPDPDMRDWYDGELVRDMQPPL